MDIRIALAGNPNCGKTTLFNALTGSNQFVGNWPGVTVEKKEGRPKRGGAVICDLPGIYSLSPYTPEEVVARNYLALERPDVILNVVDATSLERSLYLTTQLAELGIPLVLALNMMDEVRKNADSIDTALLSRRLGVPLVEISALKGEGVELALERAIEAAGTSPMSPAAAPASLSTPRSVRSSQTPLSPQTSPSSRPSPPPRPASRLSARSAPVTLSRQRVFPHSVERVIAHICRTALTRVPRQQQRWYAVKVFERDGPVLEQLGLAPPVLVRIEGEIAAAERALDDDAQSIIANARYEYISAVTAACCKRSERPAVTVSDRIDSVVTGRLLGLPVFAAVMFLVYYISVVAVGATAGALTRDGLFGEGFFLLGIGRAEYEERSADYESAMNALDAYGAFNAFGSRAEFDVRHVDCASFIAMLRQVRPDRESVPYTVQDGCSGPGSSVTVYFSDIPPGADEKMTNSMSFTDALAYLDAHGLAPPEPSGCGVWISGVPVLVRSLLERSDAPVWLSSLILDGIIAGVGSVLGFVPQLLALFFMLAFLESCGYMARIAFVLDRIFRKFGLSGRSFIPILLSTGCGVTGIMASRTAGDESERRITVITTTFMPCGAKVPLISMISAVLFGGSAWVAISAYFLGIAAIVISGIILRKTVLRSAAAAPFVMELPAYRMPALSSVLGCMWERGRSFIKKAGTVILLSTVVLWFLTRFGWVHGTFGMLREDQLGASILALGASGVSWIFAPLGWGDWRMTVAAFTGLIAKENIVSSLAALCSGEGGVGAVLGASLSPGAGYSFLVFNLLCAPCFAAIGAIRREMNSAKWTAFAIAYQCAFAYAAALAVRVVGG